MVNARFQRTVRGSRLLPIALVLALMPAGCDESLPPRNDPLAVLAAGLVANSGIVEIRDSLPTGLEGTFRGSLQNNFVEVLQDSQRVRMVLDVTVRNHPEIHARIVAERHYAEEPQFLSGDMLTLPPRGVLHILPPWPHRTDAGIWFWAFGPMDSGTTSKGEPFLESLPITLVAEGTIQGFRRVGALRVGPVEATVRYRVF